MTIDKYTGQPCKACGEGSLQTKLQTRQTVYKGVPISYDYYVPSCTICGATILPASVRKEVKLKKLHAYNKAIESDIQPGYKYEIKAGYISAHNELKHITHKFKPFTQAEYTNGIIDYITHGDVVRVFSKVISEIKCPNFTYSERANAANKVREILNAPTEMDNGDIYAILSDYIPGDTIHIDYINIVPYGSIGVKAEKSKPDLHRRFVLKVYSDTESLERYKAYDLTLFLDAFGNKQIVTDNTIDTGETTFVYCTIDNLSTIAEYNFTKVILTKLPGSYKNILEMAQAGIEIDIC